MFEWQFSSRRERSSTWYMTAAVIAMALVVWGIIIGLYIMSIVVFIFIGVYLLYENNSPDLIHVTIDENGIGVNEGFYDYAKIATFNLIYEGARPIFLNIILKSRVSGGVRLYLDPSLSPADLRSYLALYLPESEKGELTLIEKILLILKI